MDELEIPGEPAADAKDYKIPAILLGIGVVIYLIYGFYKDGWAGVGAMSVLLPVRLFFQVLLGVMACLLTARIMGTQFGYAGQAILKLATVFVFPPAVTIFIPYVGWAMALFLYWGLLEWLFELETMEQIMLVVVIFLVNAGALLLVATIGFAMH